MKGNQGAAKTSMQIGDRVLVKVVPNLEVMIIARIDVPHSDRLAFATKSGGRHTIGRKIWKADYRWDKERKMWVPVD